MALNEHHPRFYSGIQCSASKLGEIRQYGYTFSLIFLMSRLSFFRLTLLEKCRQAGMMSSRVSLAVQQSRFFLNFYQTSSLIVMTLFLLGIFMVAKRVGLVQKVLHFLYAPQWKSSLGYSDSTLLVLDVEKRLFDIVKVRSFRLSGLVWQRTSYWRWFLWSQSQDFAFMRWKVRLFIFLMEERIPWFWKQCRMLLSYSMESQW